MTLKVIISHAVGTSKAGIQCSASSTCLCDAFVETMFKLHYAKGFNVLPG